jgi:hypothetical protein
MAEINNEIGLTQILGGGSGHGSGSDLGDHDEKRDIVANEHAAPAEYNDNTTAPAATTTEKATV